MTTKAERASIIAEHLPQVGERIVFVCAGGDIKPGTIAPVPLNWRMTRELDNYTERGDFPKQWVRNAHTGGVSPWPASDVFTDLEAARVISKIRANRSQDRQN